MVPHETPIQCPVLSTEFRSNVYMPVSLGSKGRIYIFMTSDSHVYSKYSKNNENENII